MKIQDMDQYKEYDLKISKWKIPKDAYVYFVCENDGTIIYIGSTINPQTRINYHQLTTALSGKKYFISEPKDREVALSLELELIKKIAPKYNIVGNPKRVSLGRPSIPKHTLEKRIKDNETLSIKIKDALNKNNQTQSELAQKMNISRQRMSQIITAPATLREETIKKLESALGEKLV
jgi:predicted GIY-YIG superfamily endonuclease/predicted XRE-type DNA-binding protein